jgi:hypothetical protein
VNSAPVYPYGMYGDLPVAGDWTGTGSATWNIGVYRGSGLWYVDSNGDHVYETSDATFPSFGGSGDIPVMGPWAAPAPPQQYYLTTAVSPPGTGSISPASGWYNSGSGVTIAATPAGGYVFSGFSGALSGNTNPQSLTITGTASVTASFLLAAPPAVTLLSPANGVTTSSTAPTLSWTASSGATSYDLYLGASSSPPLYANTASTNYAPNLTAGSTYYWKVVAKNGSGSSPASAIWLFVTPVSASLNIITSTLPQATVGGPYAATLSASGGTPSYTWSLAAGSSLPAGLVLNSGSGTISGNPASAGNFQFTVQVTDTAHSIATRPLSLTVALPALSINGGSNSAEVASSTNVSLAFSLYDQANGANDIAWGQFYLADSAGNPYCYGDWGRPNGLDLYDGNTGTTYGFGINQSDSSCTVSLASITNSPSDPTEVTVVLNLNFYPSTVDLYKVLTQINYGSGSAGPWQALGTLKIDAGSTVTPTVGTAFSQTFTASFLDTNGFADIAQARLLIQTNAGSNLANQCVMRYDRAANNLYLLADDGVNYLGPITGGGYDTLANSQCAISGGYNVQVSGNILQVDFSVVFTTNFSGNDAVSLSVMNNGGTMSGPTIAGSWKVPIPPGNGTGGTTSGPGAPPDPILPTPDPQLPSPVTSPLVQDCTDVTGSWTYVVSGGTVDLDLVQISSGVTGNVTLNWPCTPVSWQVSTGVSALGVATFAATNEQVQWCPIGGATYETPTTINFTLLPSTANCKVGTLSESDVYPTATNPFTAQSVPERTVSNGPTPVSRNSDPPGLVLTSDIVNDRLLVTLSDTLKTANLQVKLSKASLTFQDQGPQPEVILVNQSVSGRQNAYSFPIGRLNLPAHTTYGSMIATWGSLTATVATGFATLGSPDFHSTTHRLRASAAQLPALRSYSTPTALAVGRKLN